MSVNIRRVALVSSVVLGSWIAVRAAWPSRPPVLDDPPASLIARGEVRDDALAETIHRYAAAARAPRLASR